MQFWLLMIAVICVPWMLIFKPIILWTKMPSHPKKVPAHSNEEDHYEGDEDRQHHNDLEAPLNMEDELE